MQAKLDLAKAKGLKKSEIKQLQRMMQERIPERSVLSATLAESMAAFSNETGLSLCLVVNRRGQIVNVTVGHPRDVVIPELRGLRHGPGRLSGHRLIYTHNGSLAKNANGPNKEDLQCLARNRLDFLVQILVDPQGEFSRSRGEQTRPVDAIFRAHLLPVRDGNGQIWKVLPPCTVREAENEEFDKVISALEDEFKRVAPRFPIADGEERAVLVGLIQEGQDSWQIEDELDELSQLARTAGATVRGRLTQARLQPDPKFFLGSGKVQELALQIQELGANLVVIDHELSANQQRNLEEALGVKVIDRTELILDIFAQRANTKEGKLQIELAQLQYLYPRLVGQGPTLSRLGGGIGTRGPGETKLEVDRRRIRDRINLLAKETLRIRSYRDTQRRRRITEKLPVVALTGYTNSGKSTLLNALTKSASLVEDKLFATLDPSTRRTVLPDHSPILITDTVGFIRKLPPSLVTAFGATLEEVVVADILVHVVDASHPNVMEQIESVHDALSELQAVDRPMITVLNKADAARHEDLMWLSSQLPNPVVVSARERTGLGRLMDKIQELVQEVCPERSRSTA
ncbi:MAG: GTPase HflX [Candidatus Obscuribacterales bacterium]|nr:GTPase HflX [Candidatus Obscuribacterales bacterium]